MLGRIAGGSFRGRRSSWMRRRARLVALLKDDIGVNVRLIACGEVLWKLVAKVICRRRAKAFGARFCRWRQDDGHGGLQAVQMGVAVKGGADLGVHAVEAALDRHPEWICVKADAKNAFNAVHHEAMFEAIERDFPEHKVLERVQERHPSVIISAYLDDALFLGPPIVAALVYGTYMEEAAIGLDIQLMKSAAFSPAGDASCFEAGMPGAWGEVDFIDVLGVPVGKAEAVSAEMLKKDALRDMLPGGRLAWHSCEFATLPHGMGLTKAARVSSAAWLWGFAQVWEDIRELFPTVMAGTEDLGAESDLTYVNSLQAAMQKVSEAVEVVEEARGANEHLLPQVPKADDVKKLSDYSWSQKRAQKVTYNNIGPAFLRGVPCCLALELSSAEYRVALRHIPHAEQPLLGQVEECPDCGGERDPTGTHFLACRGGAGAGGGNWFSFIYHKLQRVLFEVAKSAYALASASHDDFAGHLTYSTNHCPDVTVLDAEGPGQHALFDVATTRPMSDAHLGATMMAPGVAAKNVEESKGLRRMDSFGNTQRRFRERRYMEENAEGGEKVDGDGDEDGEEEAAHGGVVGGKEKWIRLLSFALARGVAGLTIMRAVGWCPAGGEGGRMASRLLESMEDERREAEHLSIVEGQGEGTAEARSGGAHAGPARRCQASRISWRSGMTSLRRAPGMTAGSVAGALGLLGSVGCGIAVAVGMGSSGWSFQRSCHKIREQSGASPEQAMALAEGGVATLMGASKQVAGLLEGVVGMGGLVRVTREMWEALGGVDTCWAPQSPGPISVVMATYNRRRPHGDLSATGKAWDTLTTVGMGPQVGAVRHGTSGASVVLKFAASSQGNQCKGFSHVELMLGVEGCRHKSVADTAVVVERWIAQLEGKGRTGFRHTAAVRRQCGCRGARVAQ
ncbi:hypothetical protein CYMTET_55985 [Cymbomonas tetramitiformis]|uniref:Reverse transcriptase domain-containing protein n=1 Tax=Cymbomonas tetramitiformis TaxID=36881 RepID=A0AAE0BBV4_9CHLO|nr:hypothetical protein CYMTET_55985 [Cymbomonas tetramitiformis]